MAVYRYKGMLKDGTYITSRVQANDKKEAIAKRKQAKISPIELKKQNEPAKKVSEETLAMLGNIEVTQEKGKRKV